jgi:hypothetical protein
VQGLNDMAIFATMAVTSVTSGALFTLQGWHVMNTLAVPFVAAAAAALAWLAVVRRHGAAA